MSNASLLFDKLNSYVESSRSDFEDKLAQIVEIPSISMDPTKKTDIQRCAELAKQFLQSIGTKAEIIPTAGNPVIYGEYTSGANHPTVAIYNHMDVQPAEEPEWRKNPFTFVKDGDRYDGRGSTDDKGPGLTALFGAKYAIEKGVPLNIKFIWELEEEIGSPSFEGFVKNNLARLKTDSVLVSDTIWISRGQPAIPYGLRGLQGMTLHLETHATDIHSGTTGGVARNPIGELSKVITECYDAITGKVKIPGFYKDVKPATAAEVKSFLNSGFTLKKFMAAHKMKSTRKVNTAQALKNIFAMPTFEVHGMVGGYTGPGVKTVIPPRAQAKISMRLVPNMSTAKTFKLAAKFIKSKNKDIKIVRENALEPYLGPFTGPYADAARRAMEFAFGKTPAFTREGGSIGAVVTMKNLLKVPILFLGLSLPEHGYHAPNENYDWGQASGGIKMFVKYFSEIATMGK